jgi:hypothetical protein
MRGAGDTRENLKDTWHRVGFLKGKTVSNVLRFEETPHCRTAAGNRKKISVWRDLTTSGRHWSRNLADSPGNHYSLNASAAKALHYNELESLFARMLPEDRELVLQFARRLVVPDT